MSSNIKTHRAKEITLTKEQQRVLDEAHIAFMSAAGFFSHYYMSEMRVVTTYDIPTLATDGRHVFINPDYLAELKTGERAFTLIHETMHAILKHPQRAKYYSQQGNIKGLPFDMNFANTCMDYCINADIADAYGASVQFNPDWLFHPDVKPGDLWEDVYVRLCPHQPPQPPNGKPGGRPGNKPGNKPDLGDMHGPSTFKDAGKSLRGQKGDRLAKENDGKFDQNVMDPPVDPRTGDVDLPDEDEFREAVARAEQAQKMIGDAPFCVKRIIKEILSPEISWKDKIRLSITGRMGYRGEDWARPNRRRLVLSPVVIIPGKKRYGAGTVVLVQDTSGSMGTREEAAGLAELSAILNDVKPREIIRLCCDARVGQVDYVRTLDDLEEVRDKGTTGGGGTDFRPPFEWVKTQGITPEALIYVTDTMGVYPGTKPAYPVIWVSTIKPVRPPYIPPWGELVEIDLNMRKA